MPAENKIGAAYVEVIAKGIAKVQSDLNGIKDRLNKTAGASDQASKATDGLGKAASGAADKFKSLTNTINQIGGIAQRSFLVGAGAIGVFLRAADPVGMQRLGGTLGALSVQIGSIFIPLIDTVSKYLQQLLDWFRGLSDEQKDNILHWVKIGLVILAVIAIIPKLIAGFQLVGAAIAMLGAESAVASGGLTVLLGVIAAAIPALLALFGVVGGGGGELGGIFAPIIDALKELWGMVQQVFGQIAGAVLTVVSKIADAISRVLPPILDLVSTVIDSFANFLMPILDTLADVVGEVIDAFLPIVDELLDALVPVIVQVVDVMKEVFEAMEPLREAFREIVQTLLELLVPVFQMVANVVAVYVSILAQMFAALVEAIVPVVRALVEILKPAIQAIADTIKAVISGIRNAINAFIDAVNGFVEWYNSQKWLPGHLNRVNRLEDPGERDARHRREEERRNQPGRDGGKLKNEPAGRHTPTAQQKPELIGIVDAWKKAQTAVNGTENNAERERNRLLEQQNKNQQQANDILQQIRDRMNNGGGGLAP